jgi:hypothetical protein
MNEPAHGLTDPVESLEGGADGLHAGQGAVHAHLVAHVVLELTNTTSVGERQPRDMSLKTIQVIITSTIIIRGSSDRRAPGPTMALPGRHHHPHPPPTAYQVPGGVDVGAQDRDLGALGQGQQALLVLQENLQETRDIRPSGDSPHCPSCVIQGGPS